MTYDEQMKRLKELGWTLKHIHVDGNSGWRYVSPNDGQITIMDIGVESSPPPIPDELLALLEPESPKQAHTLEPWEVDSLHNTPLLIVTKYDVICEFTHHPRIRTENLVANAIRIVQCVNAMDGILNPATHMAKQADHIKELEQKCQIHMEAGIKSSTELLETQHKVTKQDVKIEQLKEKIQVLQNKMGEN